MKYSEKKNEIDAIQFADIESKDAALDHVRSYELEDGKRLCSKCGKALSLHGVVDRDAGWGTVCPGTWFVDGKTEMSDAEFRARYEAVTIKEG